MSVTIYFTNNSSSHKTSVVTNVIKTYSPTQEQRVEHFRSAKMPLPAMMPFVFFLAFFDEIDYKKRLAEIQSLDLNYFCTCKQRVAEVRGYNRLENYEAAYYFCAEKRYGSSLA